MSKIEISADYAMPFNFQIDDGKVLMLPNRKLSDRQKKWCNIAQMHLSGNHGGGDVLIIRSIIEAYNANRVIDKNGIEGAMCSHYLGFAAEESRLKGGEKITLR